MIETNVLLIPPRKSAGACIKLCSGVSLVGRSPGCDIVIADTSISRRHAEIQIQGDAISVRDLKSQNGTYVDERRIEADVVRIGQQLRFGHVAFIVAKNGLTNPHHDFDLETAKLKETAAAQSTAAGRHVLTPAQRLVFDLLLDGLAEKQVASRLRLSPHTVHNHIRVIYKLLGIHSRPELLSRYMPGETNGHVLG